MSAVNIPWIDEMMKVYGLHEIRDRAALSKWLRSDGKTLGDPATLPWCGDAMDTALALALPDEPRPGDLGKNPYWALNWMWLGKSCLPCFGAIAAFKRPTGGHVGILVGHSKDHYRVLGGNQSDAVTKTWVAKDRCKAIRWPATFANPKIPLPSLKWDGTASENEA